MLKGIDVSHYQRFDNYEILNQSQLAFVFIKATEGIYKDRDFLTHWKGFDTTCLLKGAYHFFRFKTSAEEQAQNFISVVRPNQKAMDLPPVLDIEDTREEMEVSKCVDHIKTWLRLVTDAFGKTPIIYTGGWYWTDPKHLNNSMEFKAYPLWTSRYSRSYQPMYGGWEKPTFWQFTDKGLIDGLQGNNAAIDMNYFLGDINQLWNLTGVDSIAVSGDYNSKIVAMQQMLNSRGFNCGTPDGIFGDFTLTAYKNWLAHNGLPVEEKIRPEHWQLLFGLTGGTPVVAPPVATPATNGMVPLNKRVGIVTANKLNIRSGAGTENMMVAQPLNKGQEVTILEEKNGWYKVKTEILGWVTKSYVS